MKYINKLSAQKLFSLLILYILPFKSAAICFLMQHAMCLFEVINLMIEKADSANQVLRNLAFAVLRP